MTDPAPTGDWFGDDDPADAWHPDDSRLEHLANLALRMADLDDDDTGPATFEGLVDRLERWRRHHANPTVDDAVHADLLADDLLTVAGET